MANQKPTAMTKARALTDRPPSGHPRAGGYLLGI